VLAAGAGFAKDDWCDDGSWSDDDHGRRQGRYCEVREHVLPATGRVSVDARPNGGIQVEGWDRNEVVLTARVVAQAGSDEEARALAGEVRLETGDTIQASGPRVEHGRSWSVSYRLKAPRNSELSLLSTNGGISLVATRGAADIQTSNGGLHLSDVGGKVRGRTTNGGVHLRLTGDEWQGEGAELRTSNGGIHLEVPEHYSAHLETGTVNGRVRVDFPVTVQGRLDRDLTLDLGRGGAPIRVFTTNGGVSLQRR
jgi:DUF4097 and DUF4098 domain-containing protein YvlB